MTCSRTFRTAFQTWLNSSPTSSLKNGVTAISICAPHPNLLGTLYLFLDHQPLLCILPALLWTLKPQLTCPATGVEAAEWLGELGRDLQAARSCCCFLKVTTFWATEGRGRGGTHEQGRYPRPPFVAQF